MQARLEANLPRNAAGETPGIGGGQLPAELVGPFSTAMAESLILPTVVIVLGGLALLFLQRPPRHDAPAVPVRKVQSGVEDHARG